MSEPSRMAIGATPDETKTIIDFADRFMAAKVLRFYNLAVSRFDFLLDPPQAEKIVFHSCFFNLLANIPVNNKSPVKTIHLLNSAIDENGFDDVLTSFPNLIKLVYCRPLNEIGTNFDLIGNVLRQYGQNLESLTLLNESNMPFALPIGSLRELHNLEKLEIDLELLIGFFGNPADAEYRNAFFDTMDLDDMPSFYDDHEEPGDWSLVDLLPASLQKLTIHVPESKMDVYFDTYEEYGEKFEALLMAKTRLPHLVCIKAPGLDELRVKLGTELRHWYSDSEGNIVQFHPILRMYCDDDEMRAHGERVHARFSPDFMATYESISRGRFTIDNANDALDDNVHDALDDNADDDLDDNADDALDDNVDDALDDNADDDLDDNADDDLDDNADDDLDDVDDDLDDYANAHTAATDETDETMETPSISDDDVDMSSDDIE